MCVANLNLIVCWRSASAALYTKQLTGAFPDAEFLPFSTTGTEGVVTIRSIVIRQRASWP